MQIYNLMDNTMKMAFGDDYKEFDRVYELKIRAVLAIMLMSGFALVTVLVKTFLYTGFTFRIAIFLTNLIVSSAMFLSYRVFKNVTFMVNTVIGLNYVLTILDHIVLGGFSYSSGNLVWLLMTVVACIILWPGKYSSYVFILTVFVFVLLLIFDARILQFAIDTGMPKIPFYEVSILGVVISVFYVLKLFIPEFYIAYENSQELVIALESAHEKMEQANTELEASNRTLQKAISDLQSAQSAMIQQEKMASLGLLIAGIAHEINTPIGAIKASSGYIDSAVRTRLLPIISNMRTLNDEEMGLLSELTMKSATRKDNLTTSERRAIRKKIAAFLEENHVADPVSKSAMLSEMDLCEDSDMALFLQMIQYENYDQIITTAYLLSSIIKSSININFATERVTKIVFALKSFSHFDHGGEKHDVDVVESIETVLTLYNNQLKRGIDIDRRYEDVPKIMGFPDELSQVWTNIIHNAIQAMDGKGMLTITVTNDSAAERLKIAFKDSGCGIPEAMRQRVFEPFFTTKPAGEGSGLGLDITKRIIEKHNGEIFIESEVSEGASFIVTLPVR